MRQLLGPGIEPSIGQITAAEELTVEGTLVYRTWTWDAERWLASRLAGMARTKPAWSKPPLEGEFADLTDEQREATTNALTRRISVITGGPGTGKTHLTDALARMADRRGLKTRLLAPTGRAARRLTQATGGVPAHTIHKALEWVPGEIPGRDEHSPIEADLIIVDEASMLSLEICRHLIAGVGPDTHLVLIGDVDQLPPVGPGKPFCELIESGIAPVVRLGHVFRQARRSMIVGAAHAIRAGEPPRSTPREQPEPAADADGAEEPEELRDFFTHNRTSAEALATDVVRIACERIPAEFGLDPTRQVQVLAPQYKGALGIDALHERIRGELCAGAEQVLEGRFRVGEKVITTRSVPELEIANGTMFVVAGADDTKSELLLETDLGDLLPLPYREARVLRGGFCVSVHKAQGFEIPAVIVCLHSSHAPQLLSRNLFYTAVTRAQKLCVLAGDQRAVARALANTDASDRHSRLIERLAQG
jgi:exodeoxyribonuclease V alpha subunit